MRALIATLTFTTIQPDTRRDLAHIARELGDADGHVSTTWMRSGLTIALHQVFDSRRHADRYLASDLFRQLAALPACRDVFVDEFDIVDSLIAVGELSSHAQPETVAAGERVSVTV